MGLDELAVVEDLDHRGGRADVDAAADQLPRNRVEGAADLDVDVRADRGRRPASQHERSRRQRQQFGRLQRVEHGHRGGPAERPALPPPRDLLAPGHGLGLHVLDRGELPASPERVADIGHRPLDPRLVLRLRRPGRIDQRSVVRCEFGIRLVDLRVVEVGLVDAGLEVVRDEPARDAAEVAEGRDVRFRPRVLVQVQHRPNEHVPRARQHHHERPDPVAFPGPRIDPLPEEAIVDLSLRTGLDVVAQHCNLRLRHLVRKRRVHPATERGDRHLQLVLVTQPLMDRRDGHRPEQALDVVAVLVDVRPGHLPQPSVDEPREPLLDQLRPVGLAHRRTARTDPGRFCRRQVLPDRLAVHPQRRGQLALRAARVPVDVDLGHVDHDERSPRHPGCPSAIRTTGRRT